MTPLRRSFHALLLACALLALGCGKKEEPVAMAPPPAEEPVPEPACLQEALAPFPWPDVPGPTAQRVLVRDLFQPEPATLGDLLSHLRGLLTAAGYPPPPVMGAGCNGFALILEGERIRPDGRRLGFEQWGQAAGVSVAEILRQLFTAAPGMYRMIVVVVSTERPRATGQTMSAQDLQALAAEGASALPAPMARLPYGPDYEVRALVYEFLKDDATAAQVPPDGRVPAIAHLRQAGLLPPGTR